MMVTATRTAQKSRIVSLTKQQLHMHHARAFLYMSLPLLHDYNVTLPNFTLYERREHETMI